MTFVLKQLVKQQQQAANDRRLRRSLQAPANNNNGDNNHFRLSSSQSVSSILRCARREVTQRPHNHQVVFRSTSDTTCLFQKGLSCPLVEQATTVINGASILRASSRGAIIARRGSISQTGYAISRQVVFPDLPVKAEAGLVTSTSSRYLKCRLLLTIREEEGRKRRRSSSSDDTAGIDAALALPESKKICLRVENASEVNRHGIKRRWDTTTTAENDAAPEQKFKRARVCAVESQVQSVEVSRFIVVPYFLFLCCVHFLHPNLIYILLIDPSLTIMSCRLSLLLRTFPSRQPTIPSSRMSSPRKHPLNSKEKKWRLRLRERSSVRWSSL